MGGETGESLIKKDQKLASLKGEAQKLVQEIEAEQVHGMDKVLHVCSVAFQFGQIDEIWEGFYSKETIKSIQDEFIWHSPYQLSAEDALGKKFTEEIRKGKETKFSTDSLKRIAAISSMMGDLERKKDLRRH